MDATDVQVQLNTKVFQDNGDEQFDIEATGSLVQKGDALYLTYIETLPDQPDTKVIFKFKENHVSLTRKNVNKTRLVFEPGLVNHQPYQTVAGMMTLGTNTSRIDFAFDEETISGKLSLHYVLSANGSIVGQYQVTLQFS